VERDPTLGPRARKDPDFKPHYDDPEFLSITAASTGK
jgi:hypothetical protein